METLNSSRLLFSLHKSQSSRPSTNRSSFTSVLPYCRTSILFSSNYSLAWSNINKAKSYMGAVFAKQGYNDVQSSAATPGPSAGKSWKNWLVGVIMTIALPLASKWGRLLAIKNEVETVVKTVETVVETVEKVAEEVAHVADEVANQLPDGKLHNIACVVANVAEETAKDAHFIDQVIEKVEGMEEKVESVIVEEVKVIATKVQLNQVSKEENVLVSVEELANEPEIVIKNMQETQDDLNTNNNQPDK